MYSNEREVLKMPKVKVTAIYTPNSELHFIECKMRGVYTTEELMKKLKEMYEEDDFKLVHIEIYNNIIKRKER